MSFPKLNDFITKGSGKGEYKRVSLIHSIKNSLARNTIVDSCKYQKNYHQSQFLSSQKDHSLRQTIQQMQPPESFKYEQKMPGSFAFSNDDMYKLLEHLFNKKEHDLHDRNFIRRLMLKNFPQELICAGGRDFVSLLRFQKLRRGEKKILDEGVLENDCGSQFVKGRKLEQRCFYFVLKGRVRVFTEEFTYKKGSGEYFGELEILGNEKILQIEAKSETMLLSLGEGIFNRHLSQYFKNIYSEIRRKISLMEPVLGLSAIYNQYKLMEILEEREFKTGDKIYQKGQEITQIFFLNQVQISSTEDKLLNQFKAVGLGEVLTMGRPRAKQTTYCMDNKTVYSIKYQDFLTFIPKDIISSFLNQNYNFSALSRTKLTPNHEGEQEQKNLKLHTFMNVKKVKFSATKPHLSTEPTLSISMSSPKSLKQTPCYPEYATSFLFIKENNSQILTQLKSNRMKSIRSGMDTKILSGKETKIRSGKETKIQKRDELFKTRNSFRKKRWLDQIDTINDSIICNPQKMASYHSVKKDKEISGKG